VQQGLSTPLDRKNNDWADELADEGNTAHESGLFEYARFCQRRHDIYQALLLGLYTHIASCMKFEADARATEKPCKKDFLAGSPPPGIAPELPPLADPNSVRKLVLRVPGPSLLTAGTDNIQQMWAFLSILCVAPTDAATGTTPEQGTSWLELLIFFELLGAPSPEK
jgi:hypothetical protein